MADDARLAELRGLLAEQMWRDDSGSDKPLSSTGPGTQRTYADDPCRVRTALARARVDALTPATEEKR